MRIAVLTGTRAEYGLLKQLIISLSDAPEHEVFLYVTGSHLVAKYGYSFEEIIKDQVNVHKTFPLDLSDNSATGVVKATSQCTYLFGEEFQKTKPDLLIVLGDRYELLGAVIAAAFQNICVVHIHGGEVTHGAIDDSIRHSITKLAHIHFVATETCRRRVLQLGEDPEYVFNVGGLGVDAMKKVKLESKRAFEKHFGLNLRKKNFVVTYHPETVGGKDPTKPLLELLGALNEFQEANIFFTAPNADADSSKIFPLIEDFCQLNDNSFFLKTMGQIWYLSSLQFVDAVIGNSSSGLLEAPSFKVPTINIGTRQDGREKANSVIDVKPVRSHIVSAIKRALSDEFKVITEMTTNPYGNGGATDRIMTVLSKIDIVRAKQKIFNDIV